IGALPDSAMVATRVGQIRRIVCASPAYLAKHGTPFEPRDLSGHNCITFEGLASPATWSFGTDKSETVVPVRSRLQLNTAEAAIDQADAAVRAGALHVVLEPFEPPPWPVNLLHAGQGLLPVKLRAFLDFAAPRLKERLARSL
ncbi:MAG: LysR family transcriptional regulator, partial [Mesorhizobium sp.]